MSDPISKAEKSKAKDARQSSAPDRARYPASKKEKPFILECKWNSLFYGWCKRWGKFGQYQTGDIAKQVARDQERKHPGCCKFRIYTRENGRVVFIEGEDLR